MTASTAEIAVFHLRGPRLQRAGGAVASNVAFWLCCIYVLSQIYMVPIWLLGPSWSVWPSITDVVIPLMLFALLFVRKNEADANPEMATLKRLLLVLAAGAVLSYLALTLNLLNLKTADGFNDKGPNVGLYQIYRMGQFFVVFWLATRIDWNARRKMWLRRTIALTFWISSALLLANYFDLITTPEMAPHIPKDLATSGPWAFYSMGTVGSPVGGISFHHAYPAVQLLLLAAMYLYLLPPTRVWLPCLILSLLWICGLVSGSRAGFVAVCVFLAAMVLSRPRQLLVMTVIAVMAVVTGLYFSSDFAAAFTEAVNRQESIATSYEDDGLAGRVEIWNDRVALLNQNPAYWLTGTGFGSAIETGSNGHMLFLQTTLECGLLGTAVFLWLLWKTTNFLWRRGSEVRILCYLTLALLVSALTQETLYPVPALGHFCGMFLFCLGVAVSRPTLQPSRRLSL